MSHPEQKLFLAKLKGRHPDIFLANRVIEIGSLDINGSCRDFFKCQEVYLGVDLGEGPGVDLVCRGKDVAAKGRSFDTAISTECFEHDATWLETFANMIRMSGRWVVFTCAADGRAEHGTTRTTPQDSPFTANTDYYRNLMPVDFKSAIELRVYFSQYRFEVNTDSKDLYFYGRRRSVLSERVVRWLYIFLSGEHSRVSWVVP